MGNKLLTLTNDKELRITSVELVDIINDFRKLESDKIGKEYKELRHDSFIVKIKSELETLKLLGESSLQNFLESEYKNSRGKIYPCYSLNREYGM